MPRKSKSKSLRKRFTRKSYYKEKKKLAAAKAAGLLVTNSIVPPHEEETSIEDCENPRSCVADNNLPTVSDISDDVSDVIVVNHNIDSEKFQENDTEPDVNRPAVLAGEKSLQTDKVKVSFVGTLPPSTHASLVTKNSTICNRRTQSSECYEVTQQPSTLDVPTSQPVSCVGSPNVFQVSSMVLEIDELSDTTSEDGIIENMKQEPALPAATPKPLTLKIDGMCTMKDVESEVTRLIANEFWTCVARENIIHVMYSPFKKNFIVQRSVTVDDHGAVSIGVHNEPLPLGHELWKRLPQPICLEGSDFGPFSEYVSNVVTMVRWYDICRGFPEEERYANYVDQYPMHLDTNTFQEMRYTTAYRSNHCLKLINVSRRQVCGVCRILCKNIERRIRKRREGTPPPTTSYKYLTPAERTERIQKKNEWRKRYREAKRLNYHLKKTVKVASPKKFQSTPKKKNKTVCKKKSVKHFASPEVNLGQFNPGALLDSII